MSKEAPKKSEVAKGYSRRRFIRLAAVTAAAIPAGSVLLSACGESTATPAARATTAAATTAASAVTTAPATTAASVTSVAPASAASSTTAAATTAATGSSVVIQSKVPGVPTAYLGLPESFKSVNSVPGKGGTVRVFQITYNAQVAPKGENRFWQEMEKRLGVSWDVTLVPSNAYAEKLAVLTAGGDLPDLVYIDFTLAPDQYKLIQQGAYTDLTPYLTGDSLKEYPNLAAYPANAWKNIAIKGKIYGVPRLTLPTSGMTMLRKDWAEKMGNTAPKNADEFYKLLEDFTKKDPDGSGKADSWGMGLFNDGGNTLYAPTTFMSMFRVPNQWRPNSDGSLSYFIESPEYKEAIAFMRKLFDGGVMYPDSLSQNFQQSQDNWVAGKYGVYLGGAESLVGPRGSRVSMQKINTQAQPVHFVPPAFDGGQPNHWLSSGFLGVVGIPSKIGKDPERVKELLRVLNWFAAPFGSEEYRFLQFGIVGFHSQAAADGSFTRTDQWSKDILDLKNLLGIPVAYYYPGTLQDAIDQQKYAEQLLPVGVQNPALTAYSTTWNSKSKELNQLLQDRIVRILSGRDQVNALDEMVKDWKNRGGAQVAREFAESLKA